MNIPRILFLAVPVACAVGALSMWWGESTRTGALEQEVAQLKADNAKLSADASAAAEKSRALESESEQLRAARAITGTRLAIPPAAAPADDSRPKTQGGYLAKMFKDPEMRKMLEAQQMAALRGIYSDYLVQAHLTPDETDRFFQLLEQRQMALMDSSASAMGGGEVDMKSATAAANATDDALKELLGPQRFAQYQAFESTLGPRIQVQQFSRQVEGAGYPLQDYQTNALISILSQETAATPIGNGMQASLSMSPADIAQYSQQVNAVNQRIYTRAMSVLSAPQLSAFAAFQKNAATTQVAGLKMAQQMIKGD